MGGGKETPRQKLIGMMYLVLTALLAMNVSASILQKFAFLDDSLYSAVNITVKRNVSKINEMKAAVQERGNKPEELSYLKEAELIRAKTVAIIDRLQDLKKQITIASGGEKEEGQAMIPGAQNRDAVMTLMIGGNKNGEAYPLKNELNTYVDYLNSHMVEGGKKHEYFALDGDKDPLAKDDPEQRSKDFAQLNFEETPAIAALAVLSQLQSKVSTYESDVLGEIATKVGASDFKFDVVTIGNKPTSQVVAAGTKYEAQLFISATSSALKPDMRWKQVGDKEFTKIDSTKVVAGDGMFEFKATGGAYDKDGNAKKKWVGQF